MIENIKYFNNHFLFVVLLFPYYKLKGAFRFALVRPGKQEGICWVQRTIGNSKLYSFTS